MTKPTQWLFTADQAAEAAKEVVHHEPDTPWERVPVPSDADAAVASIDALAAEFERLPPSIRGALSRATRNAAQLSDDRLQGLAELLQNADDAGATTAYIVVREDRLLFGHNGEDLTLPDVWGLTIPWLSDKSNNPVVHGRFGIGLKTLQALSDSLEAHNAYFRVRLERSTLTAASDHPEWPNQPASVTTVFVVPFEHASTTRDEVAEWLRAWGDAGMLFLRTLRTLSLLGTDGSNVERLHLSCGEPITLEDRHVIRTEVSADDGREWLLYARNAKSPQSHRAGKARTATTPLAIAFPRFAGDQGHIHVGLPVRQVGLPFRIAGQFDPLTNRRDIAETTWNLGLLELVAALWTDSALDLFAIDASLAWAAVPLDVESEADALSTETIRAAIDRLLMREARLALANTLRLDGGGGATHSLPDLAFETPDLTEILSDDDIRELAGTPGVITRTSRSDDDRWRDVLADLNALGANTPAMVGVASAVRLLSRSERPIAFLADLTAAVVAVATADGEEGEDLETELLASPCLVLNSGARFCPAEATHLDVILPADRSPLWAELNVGSVIHPEYEERPSWKLVADWLESNGSLRRSATDEDALRVLANSGTAGLELADPLTDKQANALRAALESLEESTRQRLGTGIGRAIRLEATVYAADGSRNQTYARPADAYLIEKEKSSWSVAAKKTPGLIWLHRRYSEDLRAEAGRAGIGPQKLFRLLGAESAPRLETLPATERYYKQYVYFEDGLWRDAPGSPARRRKQMIEAGAQCTLNDRTSPDLDKVLSDIASEKSAPERRRRANALLGCLARNWDRLEPYAKVTAANPDSGWVQRGEVDAWWVNWAASIPWLANGRGRPVSPGAVRLKTLTNEAMHGFDPALYLAEVYDQPAHRDVLTALGVEGNPTVPALIGRLTDIRTAHLAGQPVDRADQAHPMTIQEATDLASPLYQALAAEVQGTGAQRRIGNLQASTVRAHFDRGDGLIITNLGWRRTSLARSGNAVFGDLEAFVPAIPGADALWAALGVRAPNSDDAKRVLKLLSRQPQLTTDERQVMLEALRRIASTPADRRGQLRRQPVYIGSGWATKPGSTDGVSGSSVA